MPTARPTHAGLLGARVHTGALWLCAGVALVLQVAAFADLRHDDAYISFRYAQNLATGMGLVFNPGERVMGFTSPLHTLVSALLYPLVGRADLPTAMAVLGCVGWTAQALAVFALLRRVMGDTGALFVALGVLAGAAGSAEWVALETNFAVALALVALALARAERFYAAAVASAFAALARPDAILAAGLVFILCARARGAAVWRPAGLFALLAVPWPLFAWLYYGSPIPQSALAKVGRATFPEYLAHVLAQPAAELWRVPEASIGLLPVALAWAIATLGAVFLCRRDPTLVVLPAYGLLHLAAYLVLRSPAEQLWHLYPAVLVFVVLSLAGFALGVAHLPGRTGRVLASLALAAVLAALVADTARFAAGHRESFWLGARDAVYRDLAGYLADRARPGDVVSSREVGTLGYLTGLRIHDREGIVTRGEAAAGHRARWLVAYGGVVPGLRVERVARHGAFSAVLYDRTDGASTPLP